MTDAPRQFLHSDRDTVLVLGGPSSGKTVWISRLVGALAEPAEVIAGRVQEASSPRVGTGGTTVSCAPADAATAARIDEVLSGLLRKQWPAATIDATEYLLDFFVRTGGAWTDRRLRFVELPGASLLSAFAPSNPSTLTISWTAANQLERTCAVIALVDPAEIVDGTQESTDAMNALIAMLRHLRASPGGRSVPVAIILSKCDRGYKALLKAGGVRRFIAAHLQALVAAAGAGRVYVSSATRSRLAGPRYREPSARRPVENLVEPIAYLLEVSARVDEVRTRLGREVRSGSHAMDDGGAGGEGAGGEFEEAMADGAGSEPGGVPRKVWALFAAGMVAAAAATVDAALTTSRPKIPDAPTQTEQAPRGGANAATEAGR